MAKAKRSKRWSYSVGERGRNRVRAFEKNGRLFVEYYDSLPGQVGGVRKRLAVPSMDRELAKAKAEELATAFRREERLHDGRVTLGKLFEMYEREVTPRKGVSKQRHDRVTLKLFLEIFGATRDVKTLNRRDVDRYMHARLSGEIIPPKRVAKEWRKSTKPLAERKRTVRARTVQYDLKTLMAVLNWAVTARDDRGAVLLDRNPLMGVSIPSERSPVRPAFTDEQFDALCDIASSVHPLFRLVLLVTYYTGHRINAVLHLRWSDINVKEEEVVWREAHDKMRSEHASPLFPELTEILRAEYKRRSTAEDGWVFPNPKNPNTPVPRYMAGDWMTRGLKAVGIDQGTHYGYHSIRRHFVTAYKHLPIADLCALGGWRDPTTVWKVYMRADKATMRNAILQRRRVGTLVESNRHHESTPAELETKSPTT